MPAPEKDYAKIAAQKIQRPADIKRRPKLLVYSRNKKGKTTFSMSAGVERTLLVDAEHGTDHFKQTNPHVWHIEKFADLDDVYGFCRSGKHEYSWVSLDTLTRICNMSLKHVMKIQEDRSLDRIPGLVQKQDYGKSGELMKDMLTKFFNLDMGVIFTAQERIDQTADSEEDEDAEQESLAFVPDLPKGVRGMVNSIVDVIGRLYVVKVDGAPQRRLWVGESNKYDTGYRSDFVLPDYIANPTVPRVLTYIAKGKITRRPKGASTQQEDS